MSQAQKLRRDRCRCRYKLSLHFLMVLDIPTTAPYLDRYDAHLCAVSSYPPVLQPRHTWARYLTSFLACARRPTHELAEAPCTSPMRRIFRRGRGGDVAPSVLSAPSLSKSASSISLSILKDRAGMAQASTGYLGGTDAARRGRQARDRIIASSRTLWARIVFDGFVKDKHGNIRIRRPRVVSEPGKTYEDGVSLAEIPDVELSPEQFGELKELFEFFDYDYTGQRLQREPRWKNGASPPLADKLLAAIPLHERPLR